MGSWPMRMALRLPAALTTPEDCKRGDGCFERGVHLAVGHDLIADQPALGAVGGELAVEQDRLARHAVADEAPQAQVGGARDDAFLARRQVEVAAALGQHVVHHQQDLAPAADGERLDRRHPWLFEGVFDRQRIELRRRTARDTSC